MVQILVCGTRGCGIVPRCALQQLYVTTTFSPRPTSRIPHDFSIRGITGEYSIQYRPRDARLGGSICIGRVMPGGVSASHFRTIRSLRVAVSTRSVHARSRSWFDAPHAPPAERAAGALLCGAAARRFDGVRRLCIRSCVPRRIGHILGVWRADCRPLGVARGCGRKPRACLTRSKAKRQ